jgi:hypothetical protein
MQNDDLKINLAAVDKLIAELGGTDTSKQSRGPSELLLEHLRAARGSIGRHEQPVQAEPGTGGGIYRLYSQQEAANSGRRLAARLEEP